MNIFRVCLVSEQKKFQFIMKLNWNNLLQFITHLSAPFIINPKYSAPFPKFSPLHSPWFQASPPLVVSAPSSSMGKVMSCTRVGTDKPIFIKPSCTCAAGFFRVRSFGEPKFLVRQRSKCPSVEDFFQPTFLHHVGYRVGNSW